MSNDSVSTNREQRRQELMERVEHFRFLMQAHLELADEIEKLTARCQGYQTVWVKVSDRLRDDAAQIKKELSNAQERLAVITTATEAAENFRSLRP
jgi:uncharacterized NAD(P)/FAD-binding protein YdhS